jgi:spore cortex formation protein SpoVR/YcgB (stage V sporulation)
LKRQQQREEYIQQHINDIWRTLPKPQQAEVNVEAVRFPPQPEENILYFLEKNALHLQAWQREIIRIVRKISQYFYPQKQTQVMNEGWATFWHYTLLHEMYDEGLVTDGFMLEFLTSHTSVVAQPEFDSPYYSGINPYALGFAMMQDIRRICEDPTEEDKEWFPDIAGSDWLETLHHAMENYRDESFILQFLSPKLIREFHLFLVEDDDAVETIGIKAIHNKRGYQRVREHLAQQYNLGYREPNIQVYNVDLRGDRRLTLQHQMHDRKPLSDEAAEVVKHLHSLWEYTVVLDSVDENGSIKQSFRCS